MYSFFMYVFNVIAGLYAIVETIGANLLRPIIRISLSRIIVRSEIEVWILSNFIVSV